MPNKTFPECSSAMNVRKLCRGLDKNRIAAKRAKESEQDKAGHRMSDEKSKLAKRA